MNNGDTVIVYPLVEPDLKARATVAMISANQLSIAVGFDERPACTWLPDPLSMMVHPQFGIMMLASRTTPSGSWEEVMGGRRFMIEEVAP